MKATKIHKNAKRKNVKAAAFSSLSRHLACLYLIFSGLFSITPSWYL
jgi:hypothetical protein